MRDWDGTLRAGGLPPHAKGESLKAGSNDIPLGQGSDSLDRYHLSVPPLVTRWHACTPINHSVTSEASPKTEDVRPQLRGTRPHATAANHGIIDDSDKPSIGLETAASSNARLTEPVVSLSSETAENDDAVQTAVAKKENEKAKSVVVAGDLAEVKEWPEKAGRHDIPIVGRQIMENLDCDGETSHDEIIDHTNGISVPKTYCPRNQTRSLVHSGELHTRQFHIHRASALKLNL